MVYWFTVNDFQPHPQASLRIPKTGWSKVDFKYYKPHKTAGLLLFSLETIRVKKFIVVHGCKVH